MTQLAPPFDRQPATVPATRLPVPALHRCDRTGRQASNDHTVRDAIWRRHEGDDWAAFDQLPASIRHRLAEHAYDAWSVNALILWRRYRRLHPTAERAERGLLRYLDHCERLERRAFAEDYARRHGSPLPHEAAGVPVLRCPVPVRLGAANP